MGKNIALLLFGLSGIAIHLFNPAPVFAQKIPVALNFFGIPTAMGGHTAATVTYIPRKPGPVPGEDWAQTEKRQVADLILRTHLDRKVAVYRKRYPDNDPSFFEHMRNPEQYEGRQVSLAVIMRGHDLRQIVASLGVMIPSPDRPNLFLEEDLNLIDELHLSLPERSPVRGYEFPRDSPNGTPLAFSDYHDTAGTCWIGAKAELIGFFVDKQNRLDWMPTLLDLLESRAHFYQTQWRPVPPELYSQVPPELLAEAKAKPEEKVFMSLYPGIYYLQSDPALFDIYGETRRGLGFHDLSELTLIPEPDAKRIKSHALNRNTQILWMYREDFKKINEQKLSTRPGATLISKNNFIRNYFQVYRWLVATEGLEGFKKRFLQDENHASDCSTLLEKGNSLWEY